MVEQDAEKIADQLTYLFSHPAIAEELGQAGKAKVEARFSWERLARLTEEAYTHVLSRF